METTLNQRIQKTAKNRSPEELRDRAAKLMKKF